MTDESRKSLAADYAEFLNAEAEIPPPSASRELALRVHADLNPPLGGVFLKLGALQLAIGGLVLLACPQFGLNIFPGMGLMGLFMRFGEAGCMVGCGSVFLGLSSLAAVIALRPEELKVIRRSRALQAGVMTLWSGGVFVCLGGDMVAALGLAWVLGAVASGLLALELGWRLRFRYIPQS